MTIKKQRIVISLILLFLFLSPVYSHQPRLISERLIDIENPETSQAFYAELKGETDFYQIESKDPFKLYAGLLVPDIQNVDKDYSAEIYKVDEHGHDLDEIVLTISQIDPIFNLNGVDYEWTYYYEEFGGDGYFSGPELRANEEKEELPEGIQVEAGTYIIKVFSPDNLGKYVLVVGEIESFPFREMLETIVSLPKLKKDFFEKSPFTAYFNLVGVFLLIFLLILAGLIVLGVLVARRMKRKKK